MFFLPYLKEGSRACQEGSTWALLFFPGKCQCTRRVFLDSPIANATQSSFGEGFFYSSWSSLSSSKVMLIVVKFRGFVGFYFSPTKGGDGQHETELKQASFWLCLWLWPFASWSQGEQGKGWTASQRLSGVLDLSSLNEKKYWCDHLDRNLFKLRL